MENVLERGRDNITMMRAEVDMNCKGPQMDQAKCDKSMDDLKKILQEFSEDLDSASTSTQPKL